MSESDSVTVAREQLVKAACEFSQLQKDIDNGEYQENPVAGALNLAEANRKLVEAFSILDQANREANDCRVASLFANSPAVVVSVLKTLTENYITESQATAIFMQYSLTYEQVQFVMSRVRKSPFHVGSNYVRVTADSLDSVAS